MSKPAAAAVRAIAKSVVSKQAEDKFCSVQSYQVFNSRIQAPSECYPLVPAITPGTGDYQRIGDKIKGKFLYIKGFLQYNADVNVQQYLPPSTVRIMILSQKNVKVASEVASRVDTAHLLKDNIGTGTARPFDGGIYDNLAPINKDLFKVYMDKKIRLNWQNMQTSSSGIPAVEWQSGNNLTKYFSCRIKCPSTLSFDDGNVNFPNNFAPFITVGGVCDDNNAPWSATTVYGVSWLSSLYYEDS